MSVLVTAERFLNSLHYKKSPVGNRHPGPECRALEERCGSSTNQVGSSLRHAHVPTPQPVSSPPRLPCRSLGPGPSVPSPSCPEPRLSRVPKLTLAHNTPHEAIPRLFYPQAAPATDSYFTHDQAQPHQSTALLRVAMDHPLDDPGSLWLATSLGSFPAVSGPPPAARRL